MEFHHSRKIPVFVQAQEIIDHENKYSIEEMVKTSDERAHSITIPTGIL
jgi:hypothetical protein